MNEKVIRKSIKFYRFKYRNKKVLLGYVPYKSITGFKFEYKGIRIIFINTTLDDKLKHKILHELIKK